MTVRLTETTPLSEAGTTASKNTGRLKVAAITAGLGSSGLYPPKVLEQAATDKLIDKGTPLFFDHPTDTEAAERPVRSVRDIAAVFTEAATYDPTMQALVGEVQVFTPYRDLVAEMGPYIGLSIRGSATDVTEGEHDGKPVKVIEGLHSIDSVDLVTKAGRGGRVLELLESARGEAFTEETARLQLAEARNIGQWIESRLHLELTRLADDMFGDGRLTREERIALSSAVGDGLTAFTTALEDRAPALYTRDLWSEPEQMLAAEEARRNVPATRPDSTTTTESLKEDAMGKPTNLEEAQAALTEANGRVTQLEEQLSTVTAERDQLREEKARTTRITRAGQIVEARAKDAGVTYTALEVKGLCADLPVKEDGALDEDAFTKAVDEDAATRKAQAGSGQVRGFGGVTETAAGGAGGVTLDQIDEALGLKKGA